MPLRVAFHDVHRCSLTKNGSIFFSLQNEQCSKSMGSNNESIVRISVTSQNSSLITKHYTLMLILFCFMCYAKLMNVVSIPSGIIARKNTVMSAM